MISDNREFEVTTMNRMGFDGKSLVISDVRGEDAGIFICYANNGVGKTLSKKVTLGVIGEL